MSITLEESAGKAMNKYEFVQSLGKALTGKVDGAELEDTIRYYEDYIDGEIKKGKTEAQVLEELGDPRLIAKNIASVNENYGSHYEEDKGKDIWQDGDFARSSKRRVPGFLIVGFLLFLILAIFGIAFSVIWSLLPIIIPVFLAVSIFRFWFGRN